MRCMGGHRWRTSVVALVVIASSYAPFLSAQDLVTQAFSTDDAALAENARWQAVLELAYDESELERIRGRARRERRLAITSSVLAVVGDSLFVAGATQVRIDLCGVLDFDGYPEDCPSYDSSNDVAAGLMITGAVFAGGAWGTSIGAGVTGLRLSTDLENHGLDGMRGGAIASTVLATVPFFGGFGLVARSLSIRHANRALHMLDGVAASRKVGGRRLELRANFAASSGLAMVRVFGRF